ncbi:La-related protein like [Thalictrum thalictroides]|uniref:La-related protein like n=1 Tax=Thalictrum thalictroides TaxID=46969 RepID=A0A7J6WJX2_THATH|nr:La-related protein like [Thalictrum thalictroides]
MMAQEKSEEDQMKMENNINKTSEAFKFNVHAPEFVPRSQPQVPISGYYYPCFHFLGGNANGNGNGAAGVSSGGSNWLYVGGDQEQLQFIANSNVAMTSYSKNFLTDDLRQKINKQVEFQFSDMNLLASDTLAKHINKDTEGFVPLSVIASSKKIKSIVNNNHLLAQALRTSSKLVVSEDGKKVRRKHFFSERDKDELRSRVVVAENLPEDYSHRNLEKIFGVVGSVKTVRICHPQDANSSRLKGDVVISNKLHALVEYETADQAEKAVEKLNDERNWRKGLRVRLLLRRSPRSVIRSRKSDYDHFDTCSDEDDVPPSESVESPTQMKNAEVSTESNAEDNASGSKKGWSRIRGKSRGHSQGHNGHGPVSPSANSSYTIHCDASAKLTPRGPRMPDGTRGFTMGRGKPVSVLSPTSSSLE